MPVPGTKRRRSKPALPEGRRAHNAGANRQRRYTAGSSTRVESTMTQDDINAQEWQNPDNWTGHVFPGLYFSKRDSRIWVPKRVRALGWTLNLGRTAGAIWALVLLLMPSVLLAGLLFTR